MPEELRQADPIAAYRAYYREHKAILAGKPARWTFRGAPSWFVRG
jgi:hypothetical protein